MCWWRRDNSSPWLLELPIRWLSAGRRGEGAMGRGGAHTNTHTISQAPHLGRAHFALALWHIFAPARSAYPRPALHLLACSTRSQECSNGNKRVKRCTRSAPARLCHCARLAPPPPPRKGPKRSYRLIGTSVHFLAN